MPHIRRTKQVEAKKLIDTAQQQVEEIWSKFPIAGCTLHRYMYGELSQEDSDEMVDEIFDLGEAVSFDLGMSDGGVPDLVIRNDRGESVALIEATCTATIDVLDHSLTPRIEVFAREWENARPLHKQQLRGTLNNLGFWPYGFAEAVTIVKV